MNVRFKKLDDGGAALSCERADGSTTWQRPKPSQGAFFALHDLTHLACESELKGLKGFFSLIASGWDIADFESASSSRDGLPDDAIIVEALVGLLDTERASQTHWSATEFNEHLKNYFASRSKESVYVVTDEQLQNIRRRRSSLFSIWRKLPVGESLETHFPESSGID